jgi:two-component system LytT family sensor kinase
MLVIEVEDDGVGIVEPGSDESEWNAPQHGTGIGMANVRERLNVLYSDAARVEVESRTCAGTIVRILLPVPHTGEMDGVNYDLRSNNPQ